MNNNLNRNFCFIFCVIFLISCTSKQIISTLPVHNSNTKRITEFAIQKWDSISKKIPEGMEQEFGFQSQNEMANATMGEPIMMYYWKEGNMVESQIYRVPVLVEGKMVSLLSVSNEQQLNTGDFGASQLARTVQAISEKYKVKVQGILRIHSLFSDYFMFENNGIINFIPISTFHHEKPSQSNILNIEDIKRLTEN